MSLKLECAICLQSCVHPVQLPCSHIFCYLCVKGIANQSKRCAMCRQKIPVDFLDNPQLVSLEELEKNCVFDDQYQWFYEGKNGWWLYDERTSAELELAYKRDEKECELLIAGFLYTIDFSSMVQMRSTEPSRRRKIKRDLASIPKKGIAGLRVDNLKPDVSGSKENDQREGAYGQEYSGQSSNASQPLMQLPIINDSPVLLSSNLATESKNNVPQAIVESVVNNENLNEIINEAIQSLTIENYMPELDHDYVAISPTNFHSDHDYAISSPQSASDDIYLPRHSDDPDLYMLRLSNSDNNVQQLQADSVNSVSQIVSSYSDGEIQRICSNRQTDRNLQWNEPLILPDVTHETHL